MIFSTMGGRDTCKCYWKMYGFDGINPAASKLVGKLSQCSEV